MELTSDDFWAVVSGLEAQDSSDDLRRAPRVMLRRTVSIVPDPLGLGPELSGVLLRDVSRGGVCLLHHTGIPKGKQFLIRFPKAGGEMLSVLCVVRHCEMIKHDLFAIGAEFDQVS